MPYEPPEHVLKEREENLKTWDREGLNIAIARIKKTHVNVEYPNYVALNLLERLRDAEEYQEMVQGVLKSGETHQEMGFMLEEQANELRLMQEKRNAT